VIKSGDLIRGIRTRDSAETGGSFTTLPRFDVSKFDTWNRGKVVGKLPVAVESQVRALQTKSPDFIKCPDAGQILL